MKESRKNSLKPISQQDGWSCVPVALYNLLILLGRPVPLKVLKRQCRLSKRFGTFRNYFFEAAEKNNILLKETKFTEDTKNTYFISVPIKGKGKIGGHMILVHKGFVYNVNGRGWPTKHKTDWVLRSLIKASFRNRKTQVWRVV
ncbi:hypothetical protein [Bdellovibrio sp. BCCA]|uniref:hypothetical protein n=1 Tax=Bdellovibrio sp. BCCA TaxID=3136281 RepID=UPI0030F2B065